MLILRFGGFSVCICQLTLSDWRRAGVPPLSFCLSAGVILGIFTVLLVGGIISEALGWPFVFYIFGKLIAGFWDIRECASEFVHLCVVF